MPSSLPHGEGCAVQSIRCRCGKIVCQVVNAAALPPVESTASPPAGPAAVILCRHCKRYVVLHMTAITAIGTTTSEIAALHETVPARQTS